MYNVIDSIVRLRKSGSCRDQNDPGLVLPAFKMHVQVFLASKPNQKVIPLLDQLLSLKRV